MGELANPLEDEVDEKLIPLRYFIEPPSISPLLTQRIAMQQVRIPDAHRIVKVQVHFDSIRLLSEPENRHFGLNQVKLLKAI